MASTFCTALSYLTTIKEFAGNISAIASPPSSIKPIEEVDKEKYVNLSKIAQNPLSTVVSLALLSQRTENTKISFKNGQMHHDISSLTQGFWRTGEASRDDLVNVALHEHIQIALKWYHPANSKNELIKIVFQQCIYGLEHLLKSYPDTDKAAGTELVRSHINKMIETVTEGLKTPIKPTPLLYHHAFIKSIWDESELKKIYDVGGLEKEHELTSTQPPSSSSSSSSSSSTTSTLVSQTPSEPIDLETKKETLNLSPSSTEPPPPSSSSSSSSSSFSSSSSSTTSTMVSATPSESIDLKTKKETLNLSPSSTQPSSSSSSSSSSSTTSTPTSKSPSESIDLGIKKLVTLSQKHIKGTNIAVKQLVSFQNIDVINDPHYKGSEIEHSVVTYSNFALEPLTTMIQLGHLRDLPNKEGTKIGFRNFNITFFPKWLGQSRDRTSAGASRDDLEKVSLGKIIATALRWYSPKDWRFKQIFSRTIAGLEVLLTAYPQGDTGGGTQLTRRHIEQLIQMIRDAFASSPNTHSWMPKDKEQYHHAEVRSLWGEKDIVTICNLLSIKVLQSDFEEEKESKIEASSPKHHTESPKLNIEELNVVQSYLKGKVRQHALITSRAIQALVSFKAINLTDV